MGRGVRKGSEKVIHASFFLPDSYTLGVQQIAQWSGSQTGPLPSLGMWSNGMADTNQPVT